MLEWLLNQMKSATIEEVTDEILKELIEEHEYVVVYFSKYPSGLPVKFSFKILQPISDLYHYLYNQNYDKIN